jgi:2-amino-4-hydroxy-6-hydroxymethyldihydropteridine diphosphokinase
MIVLMAIGELDTEPAGGTNLLPVVKKLTFTKRSFGTLDQRKPGTVASVRENGRTIVCYIGIGSNREDPVSNCLKSIELISALEHVKISRRSSLYRTEPVGVQNQAWFINCVLEIETKQKSSILLGMLQHIENEMGRTRKERWGPRIIDLDILFYGQEIIREESLSIPHPELHTRRFVLVPMNEIAPYVIHPSFGVSMKGLLGRLQDTSAVELIRHREQ